MNFLPSAGQTFGNTITSSPHLAGINFTGSVEYVLFVFGWGGGGGVVPLWEGGLYYQ